jgi:ABC-type multidrug transport system fused ATPase/permease subunit
VEEEQKLALKNIGFQLKHDDLLIVVGSTGSGKTSLLFTLMGETKLISGEHIVKGSIAYVEQEPFIFSGSIKDNILFGRTYNKVKFQEAINVCQLAHDLEGFDNAEDTLIGERGINISGG